MKQKQMKGRNNDTSLSQKNETPSARTRSKTVSKQQNELQNEAHKSKLQSHSYKINSNDTAPNSHHDTNNDIIMHAVNDAQKNTDIPKNQNQNKPTPKKLKNNSTNHNYNKAPAVSPAKGIPINLNDAFMMPVDNTRFVYGNTPGSSTSSMSPEAVP